MSDKYTQIVEQVNDAFANNNFEAFLALCADDVVWSIVGDQDVRGKDGLREFMKQMEGMETPVFTIDRIIAGDDSAAAYGGMEMKEKDGCAGLYEYCDIYRFAGEKIKELRSFVIKVDK